MKLIDLLISTEVWLTFACERSANWDAPESIFKAVSASWNEVMITDDGVLRVRGPAVCDGY